jgi:hypothetical protein
MTHFYCFIGINVNDPGKANGRFNIFKVSFVNMNMAVKMIPWLGNTDQPIQRLQTMMGRVRVVMEPKGGEWLMRISSAAVLKAFNNKRGSIPATRNRLAWYID